MIYFDNAATTYPKPYGIYQNIKKIYSDYSFNVGRSGYLQSLKAAEKVYDVRELIGEMFDFNPLNIAFTKNCTEALNTAIKGLCEKGSHFIISSLEHNSVLRVLYKLQKDGLAEYDIVEYVNDTDKLIDNFSSLIKENTKAIICTHSSNSFGVKLPVNELGKLCREKGIKFILDGAQGAGVFDINATRDNIDILCCPGHKSLFGPMGTGFIAVSDDIKLKTLYEGGTGSRSLDYNQPDYMPDRFEAGTINVPGIIMLGEGLRYIKRRGLENIYKHELGLIQYLYDYLSFDDNITLYTDFPEYGKTAPILSFNYNGYSSEKTAAALAQANVCVRGGYHCSPLAHKTFHTLDGGTVRISTGNFNTLKECDKFIKVIKKL